MSLRALSVQSGVQIRTINGVERYRIDPRLSTVRKLAGALGCDYRELRLWPETQTAAPCGAAAGTGGIGAGVCDTTTAAPRLAQA